MIPVVRYSKVFEREEDMSIHCFILDEGEEIKESGSMEDKHRATPCSFLSVDLLSTIYVAHIYLSILI
jgi:hypothetical protein